MSKIFLCASNPMFNHVELNSNYELVDGRARFDFDNQTVVTSPIYYCLRAGEFLLVLTANSQYLFVDSDTWTDVTVTSADFSITRFKSVGVRFDCGKLYMKDLHNHFDLGKVLSAKFENNIITIRAENGSASFSAGQFK